MQNFLTIFKNDKSLAIILFFIALVIRTSSCIGSYSDKGTSSWADDWYYLRMGHQIAAGNWAPKSLEGVEMNVPPGLPLVVAASESVFGDSYVPIFILNILLTSFLVPLLYFLGKEMFSRRVGISLALWSILYQQFNFYGSRVMKEPAVFFLLPLTLYFLIRVIKRQSKLIDLLLLSVSFFLLIEFDERFFVYFPMIIISLLIFNVSKLMDGVRRALVFGGIVILLIIPWAIRDYCVFNQVIILTPRTTAFTSKLWGKNISDTHFSDENKRQKLIAVRYQRAVEFSKQYNIPFHEFGKNEAYIKAFINFWQPAYFYPTFIQDGYRIEPWSLRHNVTGILLYGIFLPFYLIGLYLLYTRKLYFKFYIGLIPIIHSLVHAYMVWPLERYRAPIVFIIIMIAFWVIDEFSEKLITAYRLKKLSEKIVA